MRAIQCLIISIFAILSASGTAPWGGYLGKYLLQRPFIGGLICGIVFGDITQGILIGAAMQLVYIGYFNVGGVQSIDMGIISFPCVAIAMSPALIPARLSHWRPASARCSPRSRCSAARFSSPAQAH